MTQTRGKRAKAAFNHVMTVVLDKDADSDLMKALKAIAIKKIHDLITMTPARIEALKVLGATSGDS